MFEYRYGVEKTLKIEKKLQHPPSISIASIKNRRNSRTRKFRSGEMEKRARGEAGQDRFNYSIYYRVEAEAEGESIKSPESGNSMSTFVPA